MIILFPSSVKDKNIIDPEFRSEAAAVIETGNRILLFDQKEWLQNKKIILSQNKIEVNQDTVIYRGFMLKPKEYQILYSLCKELGYSLINSPIEYNNLHLFDHSYPYLKENTAKALFFPCKYGEIPAITLKDLYHELGNFMIKDYVKSVKTIDFPKVITKEINETQFKTLLFKFQEYRKNAFIGGYCFKSILPLRKYGKSTNEYRVYYLNGEICSISRNSNQPLYTKEPPLEIIEKYNNMNSHFYTIDFAEVENGSFIIIETGDGGVSGPSPDQDLFHFYRMINILGNNRENKIEEIELDRD